MKNKIRCLFEKINKFFHSEQFFDDVLPLITVGVVIFSVVFCSLLNLISASAADYDSTMILKAGTYTFNDVPTETYPLTQSFDFTLMFTYDGEVDEEVYTGIVTEVTEFDDDDIYRIGATNSSTLFAIYLDPVPLEFAEIYPNGWIGDSIPKIKIDVDTQVNTSFGTWLIANTNYNEVNGGSPSECPSLEEQISKYNGSWTDFLMMLRQNNRTLANSYQNNIDLAIQSGFQSGANSVTLEQRLSEFDGDWQDFERLMAEYNVDLQTMYTYYVNSLETQAFEDGKAYGQDIGYKNGYNSGLNKGQSDTFTKNFFSDFIGGVIDVVDSIHFYEEYDSNGELTFYLSPWSIVIVVLMVAIVIIFLKVFRGG